jgi:N utilization substance protein B
MIEKHAQNWRLERLGSVEKALLRIGVAELMYFKDVPASVTLDEVIELAKHFAEADAPAFLNGILDPVSKEPESMQGKVAST